VFGIGVPELLVIFALALIVLGPEKLPQVAKQIAKFINQLRQAAEEFKSELDLDEIPGINTDELLKNDAFEAHEKKVQALEQLAKTIYNKDKTPGGLGPEWQEAKGGGMQEGGQREEPTRDENQIPEPPADPNQDETERHNG